MIARPRFTAHCRSPRSVYTVYTGVKVIEPIPRRSLSPFTAREQITFTLSRVLLLLVDGSMMTSGGAALPPRSCPRSYKYPVIIGGALGVITHQQRRGVREREGEREESAGPNDGKQPLRSRSVERSQGRGEEIAVSEESMIHRSWRGVT